MAPQWTTQLCSVEPFNKTLLEAGLKKSSSGLARAKKTDMKSRYPYRKLTPGCHKKFGFVVHFAELRCLIVPALITLSVPGFAATMICAVGMES